MSASRIEYSEKYADDGNEYRCVVCLYRLDRPSNIKCSEVWLFVVTGRTAFALISTQKKPQLMEDLQIHHLLRNQSQLQLDMRYRHELIHLISFNSITLLQTCHSSQGFGQDVAKESSVDGSRMARYWRPAVSRMATLCDSSVRFHTLPTIILFLLVILIWMRIRARSWERLIDFSPFRVNSPEPHILLFRRPLGTDPQSGLVDPELERASREEYKNQFGISRK